MWRRLCNTAASVRPWRRTLLRTHSSGRFGGGGLSSAVNSILLRSLKEHYFEVSQMKPPPKVSPPSPFTIVKGALDGDGPVLKGTHENEEISISVVRLSHIGEEDDDEEDSINQLFLHVRVSKAERGESLHFLCGLYPDAIGIHHVSLRADGDAEGGGLCRQFGLPKKYQGRVFPDLDVKLRDAFHRYIEERGVNDSLFQFLQAWLYVKDHRRLMNWFKTLGTFIGAPRAASDN
ncbi:hypothetical protein QJS04_geneDACA012944 [Acorus gramineus]|uniref:Mitochondrial glycoprotein n=1 Tax=Acorus gramineus TaxID=55184 RepID=A0AAV9B1I1_ACOGR|nr:hypothetical protein QJS04_geneDACA012944 [Acorus gramineus]